ncbi:MAG: tryptophan-rich sensory protein [Eubacteriales bacterium]|nr:tryptophan-rich sensory protein [Eubacteriales bacterium]
MSTSRSASRHLKWLWIHLAIVLVIGGLAAWITNDSFADFEALRQPPFAPPSWLFPVAWTILYVLMAVGAWMAQSSDAPPPLRRAALWLYGIQLAFNFFWPLFFFKWNLRLFAFAWLLVLLTLAAFMAWLFRRARPIAGWLQLPYLLWLLFAACLNLAIVLLNP